MGQAGTWGRVEHDGCQVVMVVTASHTGHGEGE